MEIILFYFMGQILIALCLVPILVTETAFSGKTRDPLGLEDKSDG